jgi:hypothetical protein
MQKKTLPLNGWVVFLTEGDFSLNSHLQLSWSEWQEQVPLQQMMEKMGRRFGSFPGTLIPEGPEGEKILEKYLQLGGVTKYPLRQGVVYHH